MKALGDGAGIEFEDAGNNSKNSRDSFAGSGKNAKNSIEYRIKDKAKMAEELGIGEITLADIVKELEKPGRDPRDEMPKPILRTDVLEMKDLKPGMILKGTVRNVIDFGAFVDIGGVYPMFIRNTRAKSVIEDEKIKILDPDTIPTKPELNIVTSLMPTIVMFALVVVLRGIMSESGGTYVIFSICSMGMGVITSVLNIVHGQNKYKKDCEKRRNVYLNYVAKKKEEIIAARNSELEILRDTYYSTEENLEHIESFSAELFDRTPEDEDFLDIYLGVGKREAERKIEYKEQEKLDTGDDLCQIPTQLSEEYKYIDNAPMA